jgi:hypothetical protein
VRQAKGTKNRDDSIASAISLRKEAAPNVGHHYKRGEKNSRMVLWDQLPSFSGRQANSMFTALEYSLS